MKDNNTETDAVDDVQTPDRAAPTSRRTFLKGIGVTAGAAATGGAGLAYGTGTAQAAVPAFILGAMGASLAYNYLVGEGLTHHDIGPDRDLSGFTGGDALHQAQTEDVLEMQGTEEEVLTGVRNMVERGEVAATMDGKAAFIAAYNNGDSQSQCQDAAEAAVDDFWSNRQQSVVSRWSQACRMIRRRYKECESNSNLDLDTVWPNGPNRHYNESTGFKSQAGSTDDSGTFVAYNGTSISYAYYDTRVDSIDGWRVDPFGSSGSVYEGAFTFVPYGNSATPYDALSSEKYVQIMDKIATARDRTIGNMATYADEAFGALERGEIDTTDLLNHYDVQQEFATNQDTTGYHGWLAWEFFSLGFDSDLQHNAVLSFPDSGDDQHLEGTLYLSDASVINDKIETGVTYDPTTWGGESAHFTYERVVTTQDDIAEHEKIAESHDDGSYTIIGKMPIQQKFVVEKLFDVTTGDEVGSTTTESTNDQNYDPTEMQAELDRLNEKITELQKKAEESGSGGGGGGSGFDAPDVAWWQAAGVGGALLGGLYLLSAGNVGKEPPRRGR